MEYQVQFNSEVAYTLAYDDLQGRLLFVFEPEHPKKSQKTIYLHLPPLLDGKRLLTSDQTTANRVALAFERIKKFLEERGYEVTCFDETK